MSALTDRITEVLREHQRNSAYYGDCECGLENRGASHTADEFYLAHVAERVAEALQLTEEWSVQGKCQEGDDCDHFGEHGKWSCSAIADSHKEAASFPVAKDRGAEVVRRWVSEWTAEETS